MVDGTPILLWGVHVEIGCQAAESWPNHQKVKQILQRLLALSELPLRPAPAGLTAYAGEDKQIQKQAG